MSTESRDSKTIALAFGLSAAGSVGLTVVYALGGQPQLEGVLLFVALGGIAVGAALFAKRMLPTGGAVEQRDVVPDEAAERPGAAEAFETGAAPIGRRRVIAKTFGTAVAALAVAAVFPIRSLGVRPGRSLFVTQWRRGLRLITEDGQHLRPEDVTSDTMVTVFPEGHPHAADSQTVLIRLPGHVSAPGPQAWTVDGIVAFSKICTHAGCPVGLYLAETHELFCPCHQSTFSVVEGAKPTFGPATRPLPQLPISVDADGLLVAADDFAEPVGPGFWSRGT